MAPRLWIAYDYIDTTACLAMLEHILQHHRGSSIIHEIGRPSIIQAAREGVPIIEEFRRRLDNDQLLVTDFKGFDLPYLAEGKQYYDAGSDLITVMSTAPNEAIQEALDGAKADGKQVAFDLMSCLDEPWKVRRAKELIDMGARLISCHTGCSEQAVGKNSDSLLQQVHTIVQDTPAQLIAMGGLKPKDVSKLKPYAATGKLFALAVGSAITKSDRPHDVVEQFLEEMATLTT